MHKPTKEFNNGDEEVYANIYLFIANIQNRKKRK